MKSKIACVVLATCLLGAGGGADLDKKESARFTGTWALAELTYDGSDYTKLKLKISFKANEGTIQGNDKVTNEYSKIKLKLDPAAKPPAVDITITDGSQTDAKMLGIYEFKDGELRMCAKVFGTDRPKEFAAPQGSGNVFIVLKRDGK